MDFAVEVDWEFQAPHWVDFTGPDDPDADSWFEAQQPKDTKSERRLRFQTTTAPRQRRPENTPINVVRRSAMCCLRKAGDEALTPVRSVGTALPFKLMVKGPATPDHQGQNSVRRDPRDDFMGRFRLLAGP
jgi:hypothetical protein